MPNLNNIAKATAIVEYKIKACFMLSGVDKDCHKELKHACENAYMMGRDEFSANTTDLLSKMNTYQAL